MTSRRFPALSPLLLFVAILFYPLLFAPFNSLDDRKLVTFLINRETLPLSWHFFPGGTENYYRPLISLSFALDEILWGLEESFMHLENILVHLLNVLLTFAVGRQLVGVLEMEDTPAVRVLPLLAAGLFAIHPVNVEAVAWIMARADLLAGTFVLGAIYSLLRVLRTGSILWGLMAALSMGLGCLCKETALFLLPGAGMMLLTRSAKSTEIQLSWFPRALIFILLLTMVGGYFLLRSQALARDHGVSITARLIQSAPATPVVTPAQAPASHTEVPSLLEKWGRGGEKALAATGYYLRKLIWPWPLNFAISRVDPAWFWCGFAVWLAAGWLVLRRSLPAALLLTGLGLLCSALVIAVSPVAWTSYAERYLYVPLAPVALGTVFWLGPYCLAAKWRPSVVAVLLTGAVAFVATILWRGYIWQDNLRLYQDTVLKSPEFAPARNELANALAERGRREEGVAILEGTNKPDSLVAALGKAAAMVEKGESEEARRFLLEKMRATPAYTLQILEQLIAITTKMIEGAGDEQIKGTYYREILNWLDILERSTQNPFHLYRQGRIYLLLGDRENARRCFAEAARRFPATSPYIAPAKKLAQKLST